MQVCVCTIHVIRRTNRPSLYMPQLCSASYAQVFRSRYFHGFLFLFFSSFFYHSFISVCKCLHTIQFFLRVFSSSPCIHIQFVCDEYFTRNIVIELILVLVRIKSCVEHLSIEVIVISNCIDMNGYVQFILYIMYIII